jgi:hypothetical protein
VVIANRYFNVFFFLDLADSVPIVVSGVIGWTLGWRLGWLSGTKPLR